MDFKFDAAGVAAEYGPNAAAYAAAFGDNLETNPFDGAVVRHVLSGVPAGGRVLDAGCGPAQGAAFAQARGLVGIGFDITLGMLEAARQRGVTLVGQADLRALAFAPRSFDAVIAWYSLLHLPSAAMPDALADIRRVMRTGAPLLVALQGGRVPGGFGDWNDYTPRAIAGLLRGAGFVDVIARTRPPFPHEYQATKVIASGVR